MHAMRTWLKYAIEVGRGTRVLSRHWIRRISGGGARCFAACVSAVVVAVLVCACDFVESAPSAASVCVDLALCDGPSPPSVAEDVLCDASLGGPCGSRTLGTTVDAVSRRVADRPGSRIRVWVLGKSMAETTVLVERTVPRLSKGSVASRDTQRRRFEDNTRELVLAAAGRVFDAPPIRRSPIAESISKIALAETGGLPRTLTVITDGREVSSVGDLECGRVPAEARFLAVLKGQSLLSRGSLDGMKVEFVHMKLEGVPGRGCVVAIDRELRVRSLWSAALKAAGAESVRLSSGPPSGEPAEKKGTEQ